MRGALLLFVHAFFVPAVTVGAPAYRYGETYAVQLHSYNDGRVWSTALSKLPSSPRYLKLDPQWLPAGLCLNQSRVTVADPRGCFVFNHDPVGPDARTSMNTSSDLLAWLLLPEAAPFTLDARAPLTISFCFKGCGGAGCPCDGASSSAAWLSLVGELVANASALVSRHGLHVRFLLDGDGNPGAHACLANMWRPLQSVYISGDDPAAAFTSDDAARGFDRLAVLNEPLPTWPVAGALRFGKFFNKSEPMIVWEPSDQAGMLSVAETYSRDAPAPHSGGMLWAINTDPALWHTHLAPALGGRATNAVLARGAAPLLRAWGTTALALWAGAGGAQHFLALRANGSAWAPLGGGGALPPPAPPSAAVSLSLLPLGGGLLAAVVDGAGGGAAFSLAPNGASLAPLRALPLPAALAGVLSRAHAFALARAPDCGGAVGDALNRSCAVAVAAPRAGDAAGCAVAAWVLNGGGGSVEGRLTCLVSSSSSFTGANVTALAVDVVSGAAPLSIAAAYTAGGRVWGATACAGGAGGLLVVNDPTACWGAPPPGLPPPSQWAFPPGATYPLPFSVGSEGVGVALIAPAAGGPPGAPPLLLLASGRAHCGNNEADNKRADVGVCDAAPPPAAGTPAGGQYLAYAAGTLQGWALQLLGAEARAGLWWRARGGAGPCSALTHAGVFGFGGSPAVGAAALPSGGVAALVVAQGAEGAPGKPAADPAGCGAALVPSGGSDALVLLAWPATVPLPLPPPPI
jgi:hypothetical protein